MIQYKKIGGSPYQKYQKFGRILSKEKLVNKHFEHYGFMDSKVLESKNVCPYPYFSDWTRDLYIKDSLKSEIDSEIPTRREIFEQDDLVIVKKLSDSEIVYYEGFVESCWKGLFDKPEYKGLSRQSAVIKMIEDRFSDIAVKNGLEIKDWDYKNSILKIIFKIASNLELNENKDDLLTNFLEYYFKFEKLNTKLIPPHLVNELPNNVNWNATLYSSKSANSNKLPVAWSTNLNFAENLAEQYSNPQMLRMRFVDLDKGYDYISMDVLYDYLLSKYPDNEGLSKYNSQSEYVIIKPHNLLKEEALPSEYKKWKRKNVTIRGIKEMDQENNAGAMLGRGLYTAALSNQQLAKQYGKVSFVLNAIPENPLIFNDLNRWEIWSQRNLFTIDGKYVGSTGFSGLGKTIEDEITKMGYDGIIIKGREMVNFNPPENVMYFSNETQLLNYWYDFIN